MNRKILLSTIFPVTFFLIALGIKVPDVKDNLRPKPRPRAVLENVEKTEKTSKETCSAPQPDIEHCTTVSVDLLKSDFRFSNQDAYQFTSHEIEFSLSRAPPCFPA